MKSVVGIVGGKKEKLYDVNFHGEGTKEFAVTPLDLAIGLMV
jgi:hypothetical protein